MTTEEKAQRYDEISKEVKDFFDGKLMMYSDVKQTLNYLFPELGESKDEKIRKALVRFHKSTIDVDGIKGEDIVTWLEKQGQEPKKVSIWKHWKNGIAGNGEDKPIYLIKTGYTYSLSSCLSFECDYIELSELDNLLIEKQGEKKAIEMKSSEESLGVSSREYNEIVNECLYGESKPIDKFKPKFKVDDWIVDNCNNVWQVVEVSNNFYRLKNINESESLPKIKWVDETFHLWSVKDAKDGDILACGDKVTDCPFIFHNLTEELNPRTYCGINTLGHFQDNDENGGFWCYSNEVRPATKEQRDFLFQKIEEAGYIFDFEKKELKLLISNGGDFESNNSKQKPNWSEEDENMYRMCIDAVEYYHTSEDEGAIRNWLKSLKERLS